MNIKVGSKIVLVLAAIVLVVDLFMTFGGHEGDLQRTLGVVAGVLVLGGLLLNFAAQKAAS